MSMKKLNIIKTIIISLLLLLSIPLISSQVITDWYEVSQWEIDICTTYGGVTHSSSFSQNGTIVTPSVISTTFTLQSSKTSQFEQHLRAILGLELGGTELIHNTIMYNILGNRSFEGKYIPLKISEENVFLKMYGKEISKPLRKLGHLNLVSKEGESIEQLLKKLESLKEKIVVKPYS